MNKSSKNFKGFDGFKSIILGGFARKKIPKKPMSWRESENLISRNTPIDARLSVVIDIAGERRSPTRVSKKRVSVRDYPGEFYELVEHYSDIARTDIIAQWLRANPDPDSYHHFILRVHDTEGKECWIDSNCTDDWIQSRLHSYDGQVSLKQIEALSNLEDEILARWKSWSLDHQTESNLDLKGGFLRLIGIKAGSCTYNWYKNPRQQ